jgi:hypothetical protein
MESMNRLLGALVTIALIFGIRYYNKQSAAKEVKTKLVSLCSGDPDCVASVEANFDACFEDAYSIASRKEDAQKVAQSLVRCLNSKSGEEYFVASKK